jgi:hypothetical protein
MKYVKKPIILFSRNASPELRAFRFVFEKLAAIHEEYMEREEEYKDIPYWYLERPHVGFLSAAVWRCGGTTLEEYETERRRHGKKIYGRCDLFMRLSDKVFFACEAKYLWLSIAENVRTDCAKISREIVKARDQCNRMHLKRSIAMCFVSPHLRQKKLKKNPKSAKDYVDRSGELGERFQGLWKRLARGINSKSDGYSALVKIEAEYQKDMFAPNERRYAGLILVLKEVNRPLAVGK